MKPVKSLSRDELSLLLKQEGLPAFRAKQVLEWLYKKGVDDYDAMTNLPISLRQHLKDDYPLNVPTIADKQISRDGTRKYLLRFEDGVAVETVGIPSADGRLTVCCSSQAGCAMGCEFCATGKNGFTRNLSCGEIVDQVLTVQNDFGERVSNLVVMGQGEPLLNFDNTLEALRICNDPKLLNIGARKMTVSTCGIIPGIKLFSLIPEQFTLAVSLHSAIQETRDALMPGVRHYRLDELKEALQEYLQSTNRRITFEYALVKEVNDGERDLEALIGYCDDMLCHVNIIPLNHVPSSPFKPSSPEIIAKWSTTLNDAGIQTSVRASKGSDIDGACGQLANRMRSCD